MGGDKKGGKMIVTFLGTAAANAYPEAFCRCDNCERARTLGGPSLRKRSAALINDDLLIDLGPDIMTASFMHGRPLSRVRYCLQTHAHADHIAGIDDVRKKLGPIPVYLAKEEWDALRNPMENLSGMIGTGFATDVHDPRDLAPGDTLELDGTTWRVLDVSGHSPGGRAFYCSEHNLAFVGDALFMGSVGRVDFPHSSGDRLIRNLRENLMTLPDETRVLSGHGPETTIGRERETNLYIIHGM